MYIIHGSEKGQKQENQAAQILIFIHAYEILNNLVNWYQKKRY